MTKPIVFERYKWPIADIRRIGMFKMNGNKGTWPRKSLY